jgi:hypothetical protein
LNARFREQPTFEGLLFHLAGGVAFQRRNLREPFSKRADYLPSPCGGRVSPFGDRFKRTPTTDAITRLGINDANSIAGGFNGAKRRAILFGFVVGTILQIASAAYHDARHFQISTTNPASKFGFSNLPPAFIGP